MAPYSSSREIRPGCGGWQGRVLGVGLGARSLRLVLDRLREGAEVLQRELVLALVAREREVPLVVQELHARSLYHLLVRAFCGWTSLSDDAS